MRYAYHLLILGLFCIQPAAAQTDPSLVGTCATGTAEAYLDVNNVRARIVNTGGLFYRGSPDVYEVPKGTGLKVIFADGLWVGGMINDELRVAGATYGPYEFWPGPIETAGIPPTDCLSYDRIWSFNRFDEGVILGKPAAFSIDILEWPVEAGAPFVNVYGGPEYEPAFGDYPFILGTQMHWWIMNDLGNIHERGSTNPLGIEVQVSAFAFDDIPLLENVTFYRYHITNKNVLPIHDMRVGKFADVDLGAGFDDYVATDTTLSLVYGYNADDDDDGNYGTAPPAIGIATIEASHSRGGFPSDNPSDRPADYGDFMTNSMYYSGGGGNVGDPGNGVDIYNYLRNIWKNGMPLTIGGNGLGFSQVRTKYMFPGDPTTSSFWSELNVDNLGMPVPPADRRMISSYGPFDLDPGDSVTFTYAYVWARGASNLDSITKLKELTRIVHVAKESILQPLPEDYWFKFIDRNLPERPQQSFWMDPVFPNPSNGPVAVKYSLSLDGNVEIAVFDVLSRKVASVMSGVQVAGPHETQFNTSDLPPGVYTIRLKSNRQTSTQLLTVVR